MYFHCEYPRKFTECICLRIFTSVHFFFLLQLLTSNRLVHVFSCLESLSDKHTFNLYPIQMHPIRTHLQLGSFYWFLCINIKTKHLVLEVCLSFWNVLRILMKSLFSFHLFLTNSHSDNRAIIIIYLLKLQRKSSSRKDVQS